MKKPSARAGFRRKDGSLDEWSFWQEVFGDISKAWNEADHPRHPAGDDRGGEFAAKDHGLVSRMHEALRTSGGFTLTTATKEDVKEGLAVGVFPEKSLSLSFEELTERKIRKWLEENRKLLEDKRLKVGGWLDDKTGKAWLDVVRVYPPNDRDLAIRVGRARNQISIADLAAVSRGDWEHAIIDTGGTGLAKSSSRCHWVLADGDIDAEELLRLMKGTVSKDGWDESEHPRHPKGHEDGGKFASKDEYVKQVDAGLLVDGELTSAEEFSYGWLSPSGKLFEVEEGQHESSITHAGTGFDEAMNKGYVRAVMGTEGAAGLNAEGRLRLTPSQRSSLVALMSATRRNHGPQSYFSLDGPRGSRTGRLTMVGVFMGAMEEVGLIEAEDTFKAWNEEDHPRHPAGSEDGGEFAPKAGGLAHAVDTAFAPIKEHIKEEMRQIYRKRFDQAVEELGLPISYPSAYVSRFAAKNQLYKDAHAIGNRGTKLTAEEVDAHNAKYVPQGMRKLTVGWDGVGRMVLDEEKLTKFSNQIADDLVVKWQEKVKAKLGDLDSASITYFRGDGVLHINGMRGTTAIRIEQSRVLNWSPRGLPFYQFPARIYVDGKFTPEAKYKKLITGVAKGHQSLTGERTMTTLMGRFRKALAAINKAFDESKHERHPQGDERGGQFAPKGGAGSGGGSEGEKDWRKQNERLSLPKNYEPLMEGERDFEMEVEVDVSDYVENSANELSESDEEDAFQLAAEDEEEATLAVRQAIRNAVGGELPEGVEIRYTRFEDHDYNDKQTEDDTDIDRAYAIHTVQVRAKNYRDAKALYEAMARKRYGVKPINKSDHGSWTPKPTVIAKSDDRHGLYSVDVDEMAGVARITALESVTRGGGHLALTQLIEKSDRLGYRIEVEPKPADPRSGSDGVFLPVVALRKWFRDRGFEDTDTLVMVRQPVKRTPLMKVAKAFSEADHPRHPQGDPKGGQFAPKDGGSSDSSSDLPEGYDPLPDGATEFTYEGTLMVGDYVDTDEELGESDEELLFDAASTDEEGVRDQAKDMISGAMGSDDVPEGVTVHHDGFVDFDSNNPTTATAYHRVTIKAKNHEQAKQVYAAMAKFGSEVWPRNVVGKGLKHRRKRNSKRGKFCNPLIKSGEDQRLVTGWASIITEPDGTPVVDRQGDVITEETLVKAANDFMSDSRIGGEIHSRVGNEVKKIGHVVESLVVTSGLKKSLGLPVATPTGWLITMKVDDDETWGKVKTGEYSGFSIGGEALRTPYLL